MMYGWEMPPQDLVECGRRISSMLASKHQLTYLKAKLRSRDRRFLVSPTVNQTELCHVIV